MIRHHVFRALWALWKDGYLRDHGWFRSFFEQSPVDVAGRPIPWMGYGVIDFLEERLKRDFRVFEFGSGGSTLFWASRCAEVVSYEASREWFGRMAPQMPGNVQLLLREGESFYLPMEDFGTFDLIVVDGMDRNRLLDFALALCHERSVILWDDSMREEYCPSFKFLRAKGWKQLRMSGIGPIQNCRRETSFFYRSENCLEI